MTVKTMSLISAINASDMGTAALNSIYKEAEDSGKGRGEVLKEIWSESHDRAAFFQDQERNSTLYS